MNTVYSSAMLERAGERRTVPAMFIEHRTYSIKPGRVAEYLEGYAQPGGWPLHSAHAPCVGHYTTEAGELFRIVSLWRYDSFEDRLERRARLNAMPQWRETMARISPLVTDLRSNLLVPTPCWANDRWHEQLFAELDAQRTEGVLGWLADDATLALSDAPAVRGRAQAREALAAYWTTGARKHVIEAILREGDRIALEGRIEGAQAVPFSAFLERRSGKVASLRLYAPAGTPR